MKVTIVHPDLGIGGAERLVIDAAHAFRKEGHNVRIVTNQFSKSHCFTDLQEFFDDIIVIGGWPRSIVGRFCALCAYIRICIAALFICIHQKDADVIFCDQISAPLFIFRCFHRAKLLFYCHYPDQLLTRRDSILKHLYRYVIDSIECATTGMADVIFVNSRFTESVFRQQFPRLANKPVNVLHPSLNMATIDNQSIDDVDDGIPEDKSYVFLSVNRFEVKKNIALAIQAFGIFRENINEEKFAECALVIAGGYDVLNEENIAYYKELQNLVDDLKLTDSVFFLRSPSDKLKFRLYERSSLVVYTPEYEHFGIVPLEAMYVNRPVLATATGGPLETVIDGQTGFLRKSDANEFAEVMCFVYRHRGDTRRMGLRGRDHVAHNFSFDHFSYVLNSFL